MKKIIFIISVVVASVLQSCEYDYDIEKHFGPFTPQVVLNSLITPDSVIKGDIYWTKHINDKADVRRVEEFHAKLYEDGEVIFDEACSSGIMLTDIHPKVGASYQIELTVPEYGVVKASTNIPLSTSYFSSYEGAKGGGDYGGSYYSTYQHYIIDNVVTKQQSRALWLRSVFKYSDKSSDFVYNLYLNNPFCDQINAVRDSYEWADRGSEIGHESFVRIPYKNIAKSLPLKFSTTTFGDKYDYIITGEDEWGLPIYERVDTPVVSRNLLLITPSDDYDKYFKTAYRQFNFGDTGLPIFNEIVSVYSNVENGVGIFAGYVSEIHEYEQEQTETE